MRKFALVLVFVYLVVFTLYNFVLATNPSSPFTPSQNIQDPGDPSTPGTGGTGCGPTDSNCFVTVVSPLSGLTAATATNTIDSTTFTQVWNWSTATSQIPMTWSANALTSGSLFSLASSSTALTGDLIKIELTGANAGNTGNVLKVGFTGATGTAVPLNVSNAGTGISFRINDDGTYTDSTPLVVDASGNLGVGDATPASLLSVGNGDLFQVNSSGAISASTGITSSGNYIQSAGTMSLTSANTTQTTTSSIFALNGNSLTSGTGLNAASSTLASGSLFNLAITGTAALNNQKGINISLSGANATGGPMSSYGIYSSNTHTGTSSNNYGVYGIASGADTSNTGVYGSGTTYGVYGNSAGEEGSGVYGLGTNGNGLGNFGGRFQQTATTGIGYGIWAETFGAKTTGIAGYFSATGATNNYAIIVPHGEGRIGFANSAPAVLLHVGSASTVDATTLLRLQDANSTCNFTADAGSPTCGSDQNLKKDIEELSTGEILIGITSLNPVSYRWKTDDENASPQYGFLAQNVQEYFPNLVTEGTWIDDSERLFLSMGGLMPYAIGAIKELDIKLNDIEDFANEDQSEGNSFGNKLRAWLASSMNGITKLFVKEEICIGETCINEMQLKELLEDMEEGEEAPIEGGSESTIGDIEIITEDSVPEVEAKQDEVLPPDASSETFREATSDIIEEITNIDNIEE